MYVVYHLRLVPTRRGLRGSNPGRNLEVAGCDDATDLPPLVVPPAMLVPGPLQPWPEAEA